MNHQLYRIKGKHVETKRNRTLKIEAFNKDDAINEAHNQGLESINSIELIPFEPPTERQLEYAKDLGIRIPEDACGKDVSALISRAVDKDGEPNEGLVDFATNRRLFFSKYIGKTALYNLIFYELPDVDRVAFFIFSIYRYISDDRHANLDTHPQCEKFYEFAKSVVDDERFMKSMNKYTGADLKFFGELTMPNGWTHTGGSVNTIAFKTAREFLINNHLIDNNAPYKTKRLHHRTTKTIFLTEDEIKDASEKGLIVENIRRVTNDDNANETYSTEEMPNDEQNKNFKRSVAIGASVGFAVLFLYKLLFP